jgi:hypothetical protein
MIRDRHSATVLPFRASTRSAHGSRTRDRSPIGSPDARRGAARDNVVPLRHNIVVPAEPAQRGMRRPERFALVPPPGGEAA